MIRLPALGAREKEEAAASPGAAAFGADRAAARPDPLRHELAQLWSELLEMAFFAERLLADSLGAVRDRDGDVAARVMNAERELEERELALHSRAALLVARYHPVARDLRLVTSTIRVSRDLHEVGKRAVRIARALPEIAAASAALPTEADEMGRIAQRMLRTALDDFARWDAAHARTTFTDDERVEYLHSYLFQGLVGRMVQDSRQIGPCLALMRVAQEIERVADLATSVAEGVVFLVEGELVLRGRGE